MIDAADDGGDFKARRSSSSSTDHGIIVSDIDDFKRIRMSPIDQGRRGVASEGALEIQRGTPCINVRFHKLLQYLVVTLGQKRGKN